MNMIKPTLISYVYFQVADTVENIASLYNADGDFFDQKIPFTKLYDYGIRLNEAYTAYSQSKWEKVFDMFMVPSVDIQAWEKVADMLDVEFLTKW